MGAQGFYQPGPNLSRVFCCKRPKVFLVASGGGHWVELLRVLPAFQQCDVVFASSRWEYQHEVAGSKYYVFTGVTRWNWLKWIVTAGQLYRIISKERPEYVMSTGALPGYLALRLGKFFGARTIWLDSLANSGELSLSGRLVGHYADLWLTQWPDLERPDGPRYIGSVL
jgi:UDP-N-acetylglucosamine:LPS N-acetylglucosamine transferase